MDQIKESVDIIVHHTNNDNHSNHGQMIQIPQLNLISTRPLYSIQQRDIFSIRQYFKDKNWLLFSTYATMNTMYLCDKTEFEQKVSDHFLQTKAYKLIKECSDMNHNDLKCLFSDLIQIIDWKLTNLFSRSRLTRVQYTQMMSTSKRDVNQINSLLFLPDTRLQEVSFRPMILNASGPIVYVTQYLYQYLQSTYCLVSHSTTFNNGIHVVKALETFAKKGFLRTATQFVTLEIKDFDITFAHEDIITTLKCFLYDYIPHRSPTTIFNLSHKTIVTLVRLILKTQYFMYNNKLYKQTKGGNPESSLIQLLINIYLFYWQQELMTFLKRKKEVFGRCYNKIFLSWNGTKREFHSYFRRITAKLPDLPIQISIGSSIPYLDVELSQTAGILRTKVYRRDLTEKYTLPYLVNYPLDQYATIIRAYLIRTIQLCTNRQDFHEEHLFIYSTCLFNRFPLDFIVQSIHQFFHEFNPLKLNYRYDQKSYDELRKHVMTTNRRSMLSTDRKRPSYDDANTRDHDLENQTNRKRMKTSLN